MLNKKTSSLYYALIPFFLVINNSVFGQEEDSLRTINLDEVMVSANKTEKPFVELTVPAKIISKIEIESSGHSRLDEIISEQVGIVTVPGFGGSEGIQLQYNSGTPRAFIGQTSGPHIKFDGTNVSLSSSAFNLVSLSALFLLACKSLVLFIFSIGSTKMKS